MEIKERQIQIQRYKDYRDKDRDIKTHSAGTWAASVGCMKCVEEARPVAKRSLGSRPSSTERRAALRERGPSTRLG